MLKRNRKTEHYNYFKNPNRKMFYNFMRYNLPFKIFLILSISILFGQMIPETLKCFFYSISVLIRELLIFIMPVVIFSLVLNCLIISSNRGSILFIASLFTLVFISNTFATFFSYFLTYFKPIGLERLFYLDLNITVKDGLQSFINFKFPKWISNENVLLFGFLTGSFLSVFGFQKTWICKINAYLNKIVTLFLNNFFIPIIPVFIFGLVLNMENQGILRKIFLHCLPLFIVIVGSHILYLTILYLIASGFKYKILITYIKNLAPALMTGFSTMSSFFTLPVTLVAAEKNTKNPYLSGLVIPLTVNIHMIGSAITTSIIALFILLNFGNELPSFLNYIKFSFYFALAQFSVVAVPGNFILVILPIIEVYLGFSEEMSTVMLGLYFVFIPFATMANILGNSAFVILISKGVLKLNSLGKRIP